jgi:hypothetical protein
MDYFWPPDYPLVENNHELYKLICIRKKEVNERCRFSIGTNMILLFIIIN